MYVLCLPSVIFVLSISCTPTTSGLYFANSVAAAISQSAYPLELRVIPDFKFCVKFPFSRSIETSALVLSIS
jgi:hypothetical protein